MQYLQLCDNLCHQLKSNMSENNIVASCQLFSPLFLQKLQQQLSQKLKPSKSILQALKQLKNKNSELTSLNQNLLRQIDQLKQQNGILFQMVESLKQSTKSKQAKLEELYNNEAKFLVTIQQLQHQRQAMKRQIILLKNLYSKRTENKLPTYSSQSDQQALESIAFESKNKKNTRKQSFILSDSQEMSVNLGQYLNQQITPRTRKMIDYSIQQDINRINQMMSEQTPVKKLILQEDFAQIIDDTFDHVK